MPCIRPRLAPTRAYSASSIFSPPTSSPPSRTRRLRLSRPPTVRGESMYQAPLRELRFVLDELLGSQSLAGTRGLADYSPELAEQVLSEAARFAEGVLEPLNQSG